MKSVNVLVASAGLAAAQIATITADVAAISSAVAGLNSQVSAFSQLSQASAIVDSSKNIVGLINKAESDASSGGSIGPGDAASLLVPFSSLASAVTSVVENLVSRKALATSLSLGNVIEDQLVSQSSAAEAFASALEAQLPAAFVGIASSLAGNIIDELSSGVGAFSGLSGPTTVPSGSGPSSASASTTGVSTSVSAVSTSVGASTPAGYTTSTSVTGTGSSPSATSSSNGTVTSPSPSASSVTPSQGGADKTMVGFAGIAGAALFAMLAL